MPADAFSRSTTCRPSTGSTCARQSDRVDLRAIPWHGLQAHRSGSGVVASHSRCRQNRTALERRVLQGQHTDDREHAGACASACRRSMPLERRTPHLTLAPRIQEGRLLCTQSSHQRRMARSRAMGFARRQARYGTEGTEHRHDDADRAFDHRPFINRPSRQVFERHAPWHEV